MRAGRSARVSQTARNRPDDRVKVNTSGSWRVMEPLEPAFARLEVSSGTDRVESQRTYALFARPQPKRRRSSPALRAPEPGAKRSELLDLPLHEAATRARLG